MTFACTDGGAKLKLYDVGAELPLQKAVQILSLKEATFRELRETKSSTIDYVKKRSTPHGRPPAQAREYSSSQQQRGICGYCNSQHEFGKRHCPAAKAKCGTCHKIGHYQSVCHSKRHVREVSEVTGHGNASVPLAPPTSMPTFVGVVDEGERPGPGPGWHIQLRAGDQDLH